MYVNDAYMILGLVDQYVGDWHNNTTQISSVVMHDVMVDMHIFFTCSCHMLFDIYDEHAASQSLYMYQIGNY